jgi:hypothetical protein
MQHQTYSDSRIITLNSSYGTKNNGSLLSNVTFNFNGILKDELNIVRSNITLLNAEIPVSFYCINATNNKLSYNINGSNKNIILNNGNYNANNFISSMTQLFLNNADTFTITINRVNGCLSFVSTGNNFTFYNTSTIFNILGFDNTIVSVGSNITAPYPLNLLGIKRISVCSDDLATMNYSSSGISNVLNTIEVNEASYGLIIYSNTSNFNKNILRNKVINSITITLRDENLNLIDFNNINWTMTLLLETVKIELPLDTTSFSDTLKQYVKINSNDDNVDSTQPQEDEDEELNFLSK